MKLATFSLVAILIISAAKIKDSKQADKDLLKDIRDVSKAISNSIKYCMRRDTSSDIFFVAKDSKIAVPKVEKKAKKLIDLDDKKLNEVEQKVDASIEKQQDELTEWCDEQTQKGNDASDEKKTQIQLLLNNVLESFQNDSRSCAEKVLKPIRKLHDETQKALERSVPLMKSLSDKLHSCGRINQKQKRLTSKCASEVKKRLKPIKELNGKYSKLFNQVESVNIKKYERTPCALDIADELEARQIDVSKNIDEIMIDDSPDNASGGLDSQGLDDMNVESTTVCDSSTASCKEASIELSEEIIGSSEEAGKKRKKEKKKPKQQNLSAAFSEEIIVSSEEAGKKGKKEKKKPKEMNLSAAFSEEITDSSEEAGKKGKKEKKDPKQKQFSVVFLVIASIKKNDRK